MFMLLLGIRDCTGDRRFGGYAGIMAMGECLSRMISRSFPACCILATVGC